MRISNSPTATFLAVFLFLPTVMSARNVGLSPHTSYHADHNEADIYGEHATWQNMSIKNIRGNNNSSTREDIMMSSNKSSNSGDHEQVMEQKMKRAHPLQVAAGSRLPDCSHACGSCTPCRLVTVSFVCASLAQAETCPISYRCVCNSKSYPAP